MCSAIHNMTKDASPTNCRAVWPCDDPPLNRPDLCHAPLTSIGHHSLRSNDHVLLYKIYTVERLFKYGFASIADVRSSTVCTDIRCKMGNNRNNTASKQAICIPPIGTARNTDVCAVSYPLLQLPLGSLGDGAPRPMPSEHLTSSGAVSTLIRYDKDVKNRDVS